MVRFFKKKEDPPGVYAFCANQAFPKPKEPPVFRPSTTTSMRNFYKSRRGIPYQELDSKPMISCSDQVAEAWIRMGSTDNKNKKSSSTTSIPSATSSSSTTSSSTLSSTSDVATERPRSLPSSRPWMVPSAQEPTHEAAPRSRARIAGPVSSVRTAHVSSVRRRSNPKAAHNPRRKTRDDRKQQQRRRDDNKTMTSVWRTAQDPKSGRTYYYHTETRETQWQKPPELATEDEKKEMEEKDRRQREFFAAMEANIINSMSLGVAPSKKEPIKREKSVRPERPRGLVKTISAMDETLLRDLVQRVPSHRSLNKPSGPLGVRAPSVSSFASKPSMVRANTLRTVKESAKEWGQDSTTSEMSFSADTPEQTRHWSKGLDFVYDGPGSSDGNHDIVWNGFPSPSPAKGKGEIVLGGHQAEGGDIVWGGRSDDGDIQWNGFPSPKKPHWGHVGERRTAAVGDLRPPLTSADPSMNMADLSGTRDPSMKFSEFTTSGKDPSMNLGDLEALGKDTSMKFTDLGELGKEASMKYSDLAAAGRDPSMKFSDLAAVGREASMNLTDLGGVGRDTSMKFSDLGRGSDPRELGVSREPSMNIFDLGGGDEEENTNWGIRDDDELAGDSSYAINMMNEAVSSFGLTLEETQALQDLATVTERMANLEDSLQGDLPGFADLSLTEKEDEKHDEASENQTSLSQSALDRFDRSLEDMRKGEDIDGTAPPPRLPGVPKIRRRNTCGTLYVGSTMAAPDKDATIKCVCGVFRAHILQSEMEEGYDMNDQYVVFNDQISRQLPSSRSLMSDTTERDPPPSLDEISTFYRDVFQRAQMETDCIIISLIYVERLIKATEGELRPRPSNWRSLLFSCMVLASKVWDDMSMWNADFSQTCPAGVQFTLKRINQLEVAVLSALKFQVKVPASEYAKYYFLLRCMLIKSGMSLPDPRNSMPLDIQGARRLQHLSTQFEETASTKADVVTQQLTRSRSVGPGSGISSGLDAKTKIGLEHVVKM